MLTILITLVFGVMRIVNIAHGSFYMLGAYVASTVVGRSRSLLLGALSAIVAVAAAGFLVQSLLLRRFAGKPLAQMMLTMGVALVCRDLVFVIWGGIGSPSRIRRPCAARSTPRASSSHRIACSSSPWPRPSASCCGS